MFCEDDAGRFYEPYGSVNIEIAGKTTEMFKIPVSFEVLNNNTQIFAFSMTDTIYYLRTRICYH